MLFNSSRDKDVFMQGIELLLKDVHAVGLYGWGNVCETVLGEWLEDISHNQVCVHLSLFGLYINHISFILIRFLYNMTPFYLPDSQAVEGSCSD